MWRFSRILSTRYFQPTVSLIFAAGNTRVALCDNDDNSTAVVDTNEEPRASNDDKELSVDDKHQPLGSLIDLDLEREAEEIIADAECPSCLRESLKGPCGGRFLNLFRCSKNHSENDVENGACDESWQAFGQCVSMHQKYYEVLRDQYEKDSGEDNDDDDDDGQMRDGGVQADVDMGDVSTTSPVNASNV